MKKRILYASQCALPTTRNGVSQAVELMRAELERMGHDITVLAPALRNHSLDSGYHGVPAFLWPTAPKEYPIAWPVSRKINARLYHKLIAGKWDIVHCHHPFGLGKTGLAIAKELRIPCVATYHTRYIDYAKKYASMVPQELVARYIRTFFNACDMVVCPSRAIADLAKAQGITSELPVMPTAVPLPPEQVLWPETRRSVRADLGIPQHSPLLVTVGRVAKEKNLELFFDSLMRVHQQRPDTRAIVVGYGPDMKYYQAYAKAMGVNGITTFTGSVPPERVAWHLAVADVMVFTSVLDTQGLVINEAMACRLPQVVADGSGATESVHHNLTGLIAQPSSQAVSNAVLYLINHEAERRKMGENGRAITERQSPAKQARVLNALYASLRGAQQA